MNAWKPVDKLNFQRSVQGVLSLLLALRQRPHVRYAAHSEATQVFAREVVSRMKSNKEMFDFRKRDGGSPLLVRVLVFACSRAARTMWGQGLTLKPYGCLPCLPRSSSLTGATIL